MASANPTPQASPPAPESAWMPFIGEAFPNLDTETYFVPPVHFNQVPFRMEVIEGQRAQILIPPAQNPADLPAQSRRRPPPAVHEPQVAGSLFTDNPEWGLNSSRVLQSDVRDDEAQSHSLECLKVLAETRQEVMMVVSQLQFKKYLDKRTSPVHAAAALLPSTRHLPQPLVDGECDILILHPQYGIIVGEIKSVGRGQGGVSATPSTVVDKVKRAVKQLNNQSTVLTHLVKDLGVKVTKVLILPNVTATELTQALNTDSQVMQDLCLCLGGRDLSATLTKCLCKDSMPDPQFLRFRSTAPPHLSRWALVCYAILHQFHSLQSGLQSTAGTVATLCSWWEEGVVKGGRDPAMSAEVYRRLVARFCGPATTIELPMATPPRKEIRTHGEAVAETGLRISRLALYPRQVDLLNTLVPRCVYLTGPPGTGKTITLLVKALQWLRSGKHVHLLSTGSRAHAITSLLHRQILASLSAAGGGSGTSAAAAAVHCHYYEEVNGADECEAMKRLTAAATACCGADMSVVLDELDLSMKKHLDFLRKIVDALPRATVWAAGVYSLSSACPTWLHLETLTDPLRCPPAVHRLVAESELMGGLSLPYTSPSTSIPSVTEGPPVRWLKHRGQPGHNTSGSCEDCAGCGELIAKELRELHVGKSGQLQYRDVLILSSRPTDNKLMISELRHQGIPVKVVTRNDPMSSLTDMGLADSDQVVVSDCYTASGLERRVVFGLDDDSASRLFGMSRCTGQLYWFDQPLIPRIPRTLRGFLQPTSFHPTHI